MIRIESLLSARLFLSPQLVDKRLFFISNMSGRFSLYAIDAGGSVPEPLLPPHLALQNPDLIGGYSFYVFPKLDQILVLIDNDGDENYQPMLIPHDGGYPELAFGATLADYRVSCSHCDQENSLVYLTAESRHEQRSVVYRGNLATQTLEELSTSRWVQEATGFNADHTRVLLTEWYTSGDAVLYEWRSDGAAPRLLYGTPITARSEGQPIATCFINDCYFTADERGFVFITSLFDDAYGLAYMALEPQADPVPVTVSGAVHHGVGEMTKLEHLEGRRYLVGYNIDGCSWVYTGEFDEAALELRLDTMICGANLLSNGVMESTSYDKLNKQHVLSFSTARSPTQIYTVAGREPPQIVMHTRERILGIPQTWLSAGEDASFASFDGLNISARLYLPAVELGHAGPRPLVYYIHGGPQSQERLDFAWFSMPLIQFLTLNGFAVFVPNARGSSGYGQRYMKLVDRDWGGDDRLDHVHAMQILADDPRIDTQRAGVVGRSYGGYMTLTLATRHPELWSAAVEMFGPYNLLTFIDRVHETWKPYFAKSVGDPIRDRDFLIERSPQTYIDQLSCPLLVIQGQNDPRVIERESRDVVEQLRERGKQVEYLLFENEGHDVIKFENKVRCYNTITAFFEQHLRP
jgi:pimeloyl-ACP methyl ester carboxylesterase